MKLITKAILLFLSMSFRCYAINTVADGFKVDNGTTVEIDAHSTCKKVKSNSGASEFVATKTSAEWSSFLAHLPPGMSAMNCDDPCAAATPGVGTACTGGAIYLGQAGTDRYMTTPGGCGEIPAGQQGGGSGAAIWPSADFTPTCSGSDSLTKHWNNGTSDWYDIGALTNYTGTTGAGHGSTNIDENYGSDNTSAIVAITDGGEGGYHAAARYCDKLVYGGYSDWYLPNRYELNLFFEGKADLPGLEVNADSWYWSSTESSYYNTWAQRLTDGYQTPGNKSDSNFVRCVRRF